jgi:hypothetical protein
MALGFLLSPKRRQPRARQAAESHAQHSARARPSIPHLWRAILWCSLGVIGDRSRCQPIIKGDSLRSFLPMNERDAFSCMFYMPPASKLAQPRLVLLLLASARVLRILYGRRRSDHSCCSNVSTFNQFQPGKKTTSRAIAAIVSYLLLRP